LSFFFVDAVKETLFIHPIIAKYFTHVTRTVIWKNSVTLLSHQILLLQHIVEWLALLH
jgi:hypothetical protein